MLRELGRAVQDAISDSSEVSETLGQIRREGYALYLMINCRREGEEGEPLRLQTGDVVSGEPAFRINGSDLSLLKSLGIDPTRKLHRRRSR